MEKIKKMLRTLVFIGLLLLAMAGIGLPIPMFPRDETEDKKEQLDVREDMED